MNPSDRKNNVMAALNKAQKMIQKDSANNIGNVHTNVKSIFDVPQGTPLTVSENVNYSLPQENNIYEEVDYTQNYQPQVKNTSLPTEIFESMTKNYIDTTQMAKGIPELGGSVLDNLNIKREKKPTVIKETVEQPQVVQTSNVDYSLIKTIVEDCVKKYTSALKKSIINESKELNEVKTNNSLQAMKIGEKFSFIDNEGNLYEAKLTFIKNINNKKGGK